MAANGGAGGAGGAGSDGTSPYNPKQGGGGGGGGAGRGGSGGLVVKFYTTASLAGSVSTTVTAGTGGIGGIGGAHGYDVFSYTQPATDGGAGTSGSAGTAGGVSSAIIATTPLVYNEVFTISDVWSTIAELDFYMETESGGAAITERGFVWAETTAPTTSDTKEVYAGTSGLMEKSFTGLAGGTTYYCRAFATNSVGTTYGTEFEFKTQPSFLPQIITCG
uniref:Fibronectin type-III domain-containing protein n=1 Tax=uncultured marine virus TaxID=186617 RepID=A0A0F7L533_9VIRU|nr:hypothetical protein [uncultured marine virus]